MRRPGILVTRPEPQADGLCAALEAVGFTAFRLPAIAIAPNPEPVAIDAQDYDLVIYVSRNAVTQGLPRLQNLHPGLRHAAVGKGTAAELAKVGISEVLIPETSWDSEGLLARAELAQMTGQRVLILRGDGGRGLLAQTLRERGAEVDFIEVYRRVLPEIDPAGILERWAEIDLVLATSNALLDHLLQLLGPEAHGYLKDKTLLLVSKRGLVHAQALGYTKLIEATGASDAELIAALRQWRQDRESLNNSAIPVSQGWLTASQARK
jgi:uroporphyrinogen-III synthase